MTAWFTAFFLMPPLVLLDAWLAAVVWPASALAAGACVFLAWRARPRAVPGLLACLSLARSVALAGDPALHFLALGIPVAVLLPLRSLAAAGWWWQAAAALLCALAVPKVTAWLGSVAAEAPLAAAVGWRELLGAALGGPAAAVLLRHLPPLVAFAEPRP